MNKSLYHVVKTFIYMTSHLQTRLEVRLPPKVEVLQMLVSTNLSRPHNLRRLKNSKLVNLVKAPT